MTDDQRKLTFLRGEVEQLEEKTGVLEGLLSTIQTASNEEAAEVFRRIRFGGDLHAVANDVNAGRLLSGVGGAAPVRSDVEERRRGTLQAVFLGTGSRFVSLHWCATTI